MSRPDYRPFLPSSAQSKIAGPTARAHAQARTASPRAKELFGNWDRLFREPFKGVTTDGIAIPGLFSLGPNGAPSAAMIAAATALVAKLSPDERKASCFPANSEIWRKWQNTELYVEDYGLRLDAVSDTVRDAVLDVLRASLSAKGFEQSRNVMKLNRFLGDLVGGPEVLGEWSYIFCLFGEPLPTEPWGWELFGHHLTLSCFTVNGQMVLSPGFWGAEPAYADQGPFAGITLFEDEERAGLTLMRSLSPYQQRQAIVAHSMMGGDLPPGRRHFADNLHLGGAHRDNRIIPYEGITAADFSAVQRRNLVGLIDAYLAPLPAGPQKARMEEIERHLAATHFCWIGGFDEVSAFYCRIQARW